MLRKIPIILSFILIYSFSLIISADSMDYGSGAYGNCTFDRNSADLVEDCRIDIFDLTMITTNFGMTDSDSGWEPVADTIPDGQIDLYDMVYVASRFT